MEMHKQTSMGVISMVKLGRTGLQPWDLKWYGCSRGWRCQRQWQEAHSTDIDYSAQSAEKIFSPSFLSYQDGLSW